MRLVKFEPAKHYEMICYWWSEHKWPPVPLDHLPLGWVVENAHGPVAAGFCYFSGTAMAFMEWLTVNPHAGLKERSAALDILISGIKLLAAQAGVKSIFMSLRSHGLLHKLESVHGFARTDEGMTNVLMKLN